MKKLALIAAAFIAGAACTPAGAKGELVDAFANLSERPNLSVKFTFQSDRESLRALAGDDPEFPQDIFDKLLESSLTVAGNGETDPSLARSRMIFNFNGADSLELRGVGRDLFIKTDINEIADAFNFPGDKLAVLRTLADRPGLEFLGAALEGRWLKLTGLEMFLEQFSAGEVRAPSLASLTSAQQRLLTEVARTLDESAEVTRAGTGDAGEHLVASVAVRKFLPALNRFVKEFGGSAGQTLDVEPQEVPDENLTLDAWVKGKQLTQLEFDFVRNARLLEPGGKIPGGVKKFGFRLNLEDFEGEINAPSGAVSVDPAKMMQAIAGSLAPPVAPPAPAGAPAPRPGRVA